MVYDDHVYHLFVIRTKRRDDLQTYLKKNSIQTGLHYPIPLHRQLCVSHFDFYGKDDYPVADRYSDEGLTLPAFPGMKEEQIEWVINRVSAFFES